MDPLATTADMSDRTQGEISVATHPFLERELRAASAAIRGAAGWHIAPSLPDLEYSHVSRFPTQVFLPAKAITAIQLVFVNGISVDPAFVEVDKNTGETNLYGRAIEVVYTAGLATVPDDLVELTLELAAGGLAVAGSITRETAGSVSVTFARKGGALLPEDHHRIAPYRLGNLP